jgi:tetratricopeptide (TPR) repeat protein
VALICFGLYALVTRRWLLFAAMGSLIPLARLELAVVLPLWALILLWEKQWRYIAVLVVPTLLLMVGGWLVRDHGGLLWLVDETVGANNDKNRYGHKDMWHYFLRFGFVTGPVVFFFFFVGLGERLARWRVDLFVVAQFVLVFALYVLFSWKLNMGNAAGFLRNLIPLTPFIAVLALDGFNAWMLTLRHPEQAVAAAAPVEAAPVKHRKGRAMQHVPSRAKLEKAQAEENARRRRLAWRVSLISVLALWISHHFYSWVLLYHQSIDTHADHEPEIVTAAVLLALMALLFLSRRRAVPRWCLGGLQAAIIATAIATTMLSETPDAHLNPERKALNEISALFRDGRMQDTPLYVNHLWFFWPHDLGYPADRYRTLTKANVDAAPVHSRFIWENHYSNRLAGDVPLDYMKKRKDLVELCTAKSSDTRFEVALFQKTDTALHDGPALADAFIRSNPTVPYGYISRAMRETGAKQHDKAIADTKHLMALDSNSSYSRMVAGLVYFNATRYPEAERHFQQALALDTVYASAADQSIGTCKLRAGDMKGAIPWFKAALAKDPKSVSAQANLALCYYNMKDYGHALTAYADVLKLNAKEKSA